jgi:hypothetical protein
MPLSPSMSRQRRRALIDQAHAALLRREYIRKVTRRLSRDSEHFVYEAGPTFQAMKYHLEQRLPLRRHASAARG